VDRSYDHLVTGDTAGHLRVWDISSGINTSSPEACRVSFEQVTKHKIGMNSQISEWDYVLPTQL